MRTILDRIDIKTGEYGGFLKEEVETYLMVPISPLDSPTVSSLFTSVVYGWESCGRPVGKRRRRERRRRGRRKGDTRGSSFWTREADGDESDGHGRRGGPAAAADGRTPDAGHGHEADGEPVAAAAGCTPGEARLRLTRPRRLKSVSKRYSRPYVTLYLNPQLDEHL